MKRASRRTRSVPSCRIRIFVVASMAIALSASYAQTPACQDYLLSARRLEQILDSALGPAKAIVTKRTVGIEQDNGGCQVKIRLDLNFLNTACSIDTCSKTVFEGRKIGFDTLRLHGCNALFDATGLPRTIPRSLTDASAEIKNHCGSKNYDIVGIVSARVEGEYTLRVLLRPSLPRGNP
jgi:hypothetical protein